MAVEEAASINPIRVPANFNRLVDIAIPIGLSILGKASP
jgi:hypothetical protein